MLATALNPTLALMMDLLVLLIHLVAVLARLGGGGPSWLTVIGHAKDSLWSVDLFRCESILVGSKNSNLLNDPDFMTEMLAN